jgi:hypothetical protein
MADEVSKFVKNRWQTLRLHALSTVFDLADYLVVWLGVVCAHFVRLALVLIGIDSEILKPVHWMETVTTLFLFCSFFWRVVLRAARSKG